MIFPHPTGSKNKNKNKKQHQQQKHAQKTTTKQKQQNQFIDITREHSMGEKVRIQGSRKPPSGCRGQKGFTLGQATFSNHLPAR